MKSGMRSDGKDQCNVRKAVSHDRTVLILFRDRGELVEHVCALALTSRTNESHRKRAHQLRAFLMRDNWNLIFDLDALGVSFCIF